MEWIFFVITFLWAMGIIHYKKDSNFAFIPAFVLFWVSAFFAVFNLMDFAEQIMRVSFIGWAIGVVGALIEYKKLKQSS